MGRFCTAWTQFVLCVLLPWLLHTISLFSNWWVVIDGHYIGLFYEKDSNGELHAHGLYFIIFWLNDLVYI